MNPRNGSYYRQLGRDPTYTGFPHQIYLRTTQTAMTISPDLIFSIKNYHRFHFTDIFNLQGLFKFNESHKKAQMKKTQRVTRFLDNYKSINCKMSAGPAEVSVV